MNRFLSENNQVLPTLRPRYFLLFAAIYLYAFPYFSQLKSANELPRVLMTQEVVDRGVFHLDHRLGELGSRMDLSRGPDGHFYQNKAPGPSFLAVPSYLICKLFGVKSPAAITWVFRVTVSTIPTLIFLFIFYRLSEVFTSSEPARRTALFAYALASPVFPYALVFFSHQPAAYFVGSSFAAAVYVARGMTDRPRLLTALTGFLAGMAVMMDYQAFLASGVVCGYLVARARPRGRNLLLLGLGVLPPALALGAYHMACFGSPWKTGYSFSDEPITRGGHFGVGPSWESLSTTLFLPSNGLLVLAPWVLLAVVGAVAILRSPVARERVGAEVVACLAVFTFYLVFLSSLPPFMARAGWSLGPRYMTAALPFVAWLAAAGFEVAQRKLWSDVLATGLVMTGGVIFVAAATTYPHWPEGLRNPLYELTFPLIFAGYAVHSLGTALGLQGFLSIVPMYAGALALALWLLSAGRPHKLRVLALSCAFATLLVGAHRAFPTTGPYSKRAWGFVTSTWEPVRAPPPGSPR